MRSEPRMNPSVTHVSSDASDDELFLARRCYRIPEVLVIPRIDLALTLDVRRIRMQRDDLRRQRAVLPYICE